MHYVKKGWDKIKKSLDAITELYTLEETRNKLITDDYYKKFHGRAKNRTMIVEDPILYKSIYKHTEEMGEAFRIQNVTCRNHANFTKRMKFIIEFNGELESLKCKCGKMYTWTMYCKYCAAFYIKHFQGKKHPEHVKLKMRNTAITLISNLYGHQLCPRYNKNSIKIIEEYGALHGYNFKHAENGGEFTYGGYYADGYDQINNVWIEVDEDHHFDIHGNLTERDILRQKYIEDNLKCKFVRIRYNV